ncbi:metallophosphoesterase [Marimonas sp. MJW-29]|uniref:Metallophosphoesterase n=1 Tax=Sulfitobacter sediminis TaxID=3234186 RepID=A0ABV3RP17_9RHOB
MVTHRDLGVLDGPLLIFGGPYSNAQALAALVDVAEGHHIPPGQMICTGDVVAYCGAPVETVARMRALGCPVVAGNCEIQLGGGAQDCGCGFEAGTACDLLSAGWYGYARRVLGPDDTAWMAGLPNLLSFRHQGARYAVIHGGLTDVARFIWPVSEPGVFAEEFAAVSKAIGPVERIIAGHCGIPFITDTPGGQWINAGVIGMPPHDGRQQTRYAILDGGEVRIGRLSYDADAAAADMARAGLPEGYRRGLLTGYWPSEDVLPPGLRVPSLASG